MPYEDVGMYYGLTVYGGFALGFPVPLLDYIYRTLEWENKLMTASNDILLKKTIRQKVKDM